MDRSVWHLSPQRLISGMSIVGEWEDRLLAILNTVKFWNSTLYLDDLLGLYSAGVCSSSDLSVAQVLKPHVERQEFRLLAESTPEAFRVLQERDRGFADLFHVIRVGETSHTDTLRILVSAMAQHENRYHCRFDLPVLPVIMELQGRYVRDAAFPGKAASFARQLALKHRRGSVSREQVFEEFHTVSGLAVTFLDGQKKLERAGIEEGIRAGVIGQDAAVQTVTDSICRVKARLNDPERPLGTFLFVGPTGVGKTQCAKAAAGFLFGDEERLVRFDMNEYSDSYSAARLVGTFLEPEGLLTGEIRRRPFCVLLLDEIEKAHPDVFDLLLQVLGEGRLTDAQGRTADFRNVIIIMTSNLGAREVRSQLGFRENDLADDPVYLSAARKFFRPEFFNRLDKVVPFSSLTRPEIAVIAGRLIDEVMGRYGLRQRKCILNVDGSAMERLLEAGYQPRLGARALKRIIEKQLAQPVANCLAPLPPGVSTVITAYAGRDGIAVATQGLLEAPPCEAPALLSRKAEEVLGAAGAFIARVEAETAALRPDKPIMVGEISLQHRAYAALSEEVHQVKERRNRLAETLEYSPDAVVSPALLAKHRVSVKWWPHLQELVSRDNLKETLREMADEAAARERKDAEVINPLITECRLLDIILRAPNPESVLLYCYSSDGSGNRFFKLLGRFYGSALSGINGCNIEQFEAPGGGGWLVTGPNAGRLLGNECGTQILVDGEKIAVAGLKVVPVTDPDSVRELLRMQAAARSEWVRKLGTGEARMEDDPCHYGPVIRLFEGETSVADFRTGIVSKKWPAGEIPRRLVLGVLELPPELKRED